MPSETALKIGYFSCSAEDQPAMSLHIGTKLLPEIRHLFLDGSSHGFPIITRLRANR